MEFLVTLLLSFSIFAAAIVAMSIGVMSGRKPIKGSCGGLNGQSCELCSGAHCKRASNQDDSRDGD